MCRFLEESGSRGTQNARAKAKKQKAKAKAKENTGVLRSAQNDKQKRRSEDNWNGMGPEISCG
jgi:hypothetical protein